MSLSIGESVVSARYESEVILSSDLLQLSQTVQMVCSEATNGYVLSGMVLGPLAGIALKCKSLSLFSHFFKDSKIASFAFKPLASGIGLLGEGGIIHFTPALLQTGSFGPNAWNGSLSSTLTIMACKMTARFGLPPNVVMNHMVQNCAIMGAQEVSGVLGFSERVQESFMIRFSEAEVANIQIGAGMSIVHGTAHGIRYMEATFQVQTSARGSFNLFQGLRNLFSPAREAVTDNGILAAVPEGVREEIQAKQARDGAAGLKMAGSEGREGTAGIATEVAGAETGEIEARPIELAWEDLTVMIPTSFHLMPTALEILPLVVGTKTGEVYQIRDIEAPLAVVERVFSPEEARLYTPFKQVANKPTHIYGSPDAEIEAPVNHIFARRGSLVVAFGGDFTDLYHAPRNLRQEGYPQIRYMTTTEFSEFCRELAPYLHNQVEGIFWSMGHTSPTSSSIEFANLYLSARRLLEMTSLICDPLDPIQQELASNLETNRRIYLIHLRLFNQRITQTTDIIFPWDVVTGSHPYKKDIHKALPEDLRILRALGDFGTAERNGEVPSILSEASEVTFDAETGTYRQSIKPSLVSAIGYGAVTGNIHAAASEILDIGIPAFSATVGLAMRALEKHINIPTAQQIIERGAAACSGMILPMHLSVNGDYYPIPLVVAQEGIELTLKRKEIIRREKLLNVELSHTVQALGVPESNFTSKIVPVTDAIGFGATKMTPQALAKTTIVDIPPLVMTAELRSQFRKRSGDWNPLHGIDNPPPEIESNIAAKMAGFKDAIGHGMISFEYAMRAAYSAYESLHPSDPVRIFKGRFVGTVVDGDILRPRVPKKAVAEDSRWKPRGDYEVEVVNQRDEIIFSLWLKKIEPAAETSSTPPSDTETGGEKGSDGRQKAVPATTSAETPAELVPTLENSAGVIELALTAGGPAALEALTATPHDPQVVRGISAAFGSAATPPPITGGEPTAPRGKIGVIFGDSYRPGITHYFSRELSHLPFFRVVATAEQQVPGVGRLLNSFNETSGLGPQDTFPAAIASNIGIVLLLQKAGFFPYAVAGYGVPGEISALIAAGMISFNQGLSLGHLAGRLIQEAYPAGRGGMLQISSLPHDRTNVLCAQITSEMGEHVIISGHHGRELVVSGSQQALALLTSKIREQGGVATPLSSQYPLHSLLLLSAQGEFVPGVAEIFPNSHVDRPEELEAAAQRARDGNGTYIVSSVDGETTYTRAQARRALQTQLIAPVRLDLITQQLDALGVRTLLRIGSGNPTMEVLQALRSMGVDLLNVETPDALAKVVSDFQTMGALHVRREPLIRISNLVEVGFDGFPVSSSPQRGVSDSFNEFPGAGSSRPPFDETLTPRITGGDAEPVSSEALAAQELVRRVVDPSREVSFDGLPSSSSPRTVAFDPSDRFPGAGSSRPVFDETLTPSITGGDAESVRPEDLPIAERVKRVPEILTPSRSQPASVEQMVDHLDRIIRDDPTEMVYGVFPIRVAAGAIELRDSLVAAADLIPELADAVARDPWRPIAILGPNGQMGRQFATLLLAAGHQNPFFWYYLTPEAAEASAKLLANPRVASSQRGLLPRKRQEEMQRLCALRAFAQSNGIPLQAIDVDADGRLLQADGDQVIRKPLPPEIIAGIEQRRRIAYEQTGKFPNVSFLNGYAGAPDLGAPIGSPATFFNLTETKEGLRLAIVNTPILDPKTAQGTMLEMGQGHDHIVSQFLAQEGWSGPDSIFAGLTWSSRAILGNFLLSYSPKSALGLSKDRLETLIRNRFAASGPELQQGLHLIGDFPFFPSAASGAIPGMTLFTRILQSVFAEKGILPVPSRLASQFLIKALSGKRDSRDLGADVFVSHAEKENLPFVIGILQELYRRGREIERTVRGLPADMPVNQFPAIETLTGDNNPRPIILSAERTEQALAGLPINLSI